ncbi:hypothetical protein [Microcoleus sp. FACHB-672]|nr:hypothetical protein [Microcoleus sp. FACHB-672]
MPNAPSPMPITNAFNLTPELRAGNHPSTQEPAPAKSRLKFP